jgi:ubiquinone/menaquinone biosynthesis C-methylase UbiE
MSRAADGYVMGRTTQEADRLGAQSALLAAPTDGILDQLVLIPGMSCLDVGCGAGDVMLAMGKRVAPGGRVVGLDVDARLGHEAVDRLNAEAGTSMYEFIEGDVPTTSAVEPASYSLTFARFVLLHLREPAAALRRMWEWTTPGGTLVVVDFDIGTSCLDRHTATRKLHALAEQLFTASRLDHRRGSRLPGYFTEAGLGEPDGVLATAMLDGLM